jgi:hypothetical protein
MRNRPLPPQKRTNSFREEKNPITSRRLFASYFQCKSDPNTLERIRTGRYACDIDQKELLEFDFIEYDRESVTPRDIVFMNLFEIRPNVFIKMIQRQKDLH